MTPQRGIKVIQIIDIFQIRPIHLYKWYSLKKTLQNVDLSVPGRYEGGSHDAGKPLLNSVQKVVTYFI